MNRQRLKAELCRRDLKTFIKTAWPTVEPTPLVWGWHIDAIAEHLSAVSAGQIRKLLITIPPRHGKSTIVSVLWPSWEWITRPELRWLCASYAEALAIRDAVRARRLIQSAWYQQNWSDRFQFAGDQNQKSRIDTDRGGHRIAVGTGGSATGEGGDRLLIDDAHNIASVESNEVRKGVLDWFDQVWSTRANDPQTTARVMIGQRVHENDLAGHVLEQGGWEHLNLPAEYEAVEKRATSIGWTDPRTAEGELLWPERFGPSEVAESKRVLGSYAFSAQCQQRPAPAGGGVFKREWWRYFREIPEDISDRLLSVDCSFKGASDSDWVVIQAWGRKGADKYLLDQCRRRMNFPETIAATRRMVEKWPEARRKIIELKANGQALVDTLKREIAGFVGYSPKESKEARAAAVSPEVESGNVWIPDPSLQPWVNDFLNECSTFPRGRNDDQVDCAVQALLHYGKGPRYGLIEYLERETAKHDQEIAARIQATSNRIAAYAPLIPLIAKPAREYIQTATNEAGRVIGSDGVKWYWIDTGEVIADQ